MDKIRKDRHQHQTSYDYITRDLRRELTRK